MPARIIELSSYHHAMLGCVVVGMGVALLPRSVLSTFPESRRLSVHTVAEPTNSLMTLLIWRKDDASPNVQALAQILTD